MVRAEERETTGGSIPPLFFASVDIKHCYDTVDQVIDRLNGKALIS